MAIKHEKEDKKVETEVEKPQEETPTPKKAKKLTEKKDYVATKMRLYHPFQKRFMNPGTPESLEPDGWLASQIAAGLVTEA